MHRSRTIYTHTYLFAVLQTCSACERLLLQVSLLQYVPTTTWSPLDVAAVDRGYVPALSHDCLSYSAHMIT